MTLLDTNALLWLAFDDDRIGPVARERVTTDGSEVWFSPVSIFEIETKSRLGKLTVPGNVLQHALASGYGQKPLGGLEAELAGRLDWVREDPFDRLLVAQTRLLSLEFLTSDRKILADEPLGGLEAELAGRLDWVREDPFDRLLVAQTRLLSLVSDERPKDPR